MKRSILYIIIIAIAALSSCVVVDDEINIGEAVEKPTTSNTSINPACVVESQSVSRAKQAGIAVRSLIDQITTKRLDSNFLRIDEDLDNTNEGLYTFTGNDATTPYEVNWNKAMLLEAIVTSSPDNTEGVHYRSVSLAPEQSYKLNIVERDNGGVRENDTTHFYHTRMIGWYPKNCTLPKKEGVPANAQFEYSDFDAVRLNETVEIDGVPTEVVALHFTGLDNETDLMVSDVCEGQPWHKYNPSSPHRSDIHPKDASNIYRSPFGHNFVSPSYANFFTYRHYRSAIRLTAYAEQSEHNLKMWGEIESVIIRNQPTSCKIWLPSKLGEHGEVYHWGDYENMPIVCTPMFDNDSNHPEFSEAATYPIKLKGVSSEDVYLGYSLVQPNSDVELEIHTTSGVYNTTIEARHPEKDENGQDIVVDIFEAGCIYDVKLNLKTDGSIGAILSKEGDEHYYNLSNLHEYELPEDPNNPLENNNISIYKLANCYVVSPNEFKDAGGNDIYDGYCFLAMIVGNGQAGIISSGTQKLYPTHEDIHPTSAHLLWESSLGLISDVELKYGYVRFKLTDSSKRGNAVIAVYDDNDKVLWSWHIWITDKPAEQSFSTGAHEIVLLDRNLGATAATCTSASDALNTYGLYYQWGRKDPSMGPSTYNYGPINLNTYPYYDFSSDEKTAAEVKQIAEPTLKDGVENPMFLILPTSQPLNYVFNWLYERYDFLWGYDLATGMTTKTIYDPCPYGYRVPSSELSALFSMGSGTAGTYGYTRNVDGESFFFPYTGYKGVDMGQASLICSWKFVGQKGDYQSSMYCTDPNAQTNISRPVKKYMHRSRVYLSKVSSWEETGVNNYSGYVHNDFANRRTAAPVRCVKDEVIGSISATITPSIDLFAPGAIMSLAYTASSYGSAIQSIRITAHYEDSKGAAHEVVVRETNNMSIYNIESTVPYILPTDCVGDGVLFKMRVQNEHGLVYTTNTLVEILNMEAEFYKWEDDVLTSITHNTRDYAVVGERINYYVSIRSNNIPTTVMIDGITATRGVDIVGSDGATLSTWYVEWSQNSKGIYDIPVEVTVGDKTSTFDMPQMKVAGLTVGSRATSLTTNGSQMYLIQNTAYTSTYMTSENSSAAASTSQNYYNLFTIHSGQIRSVARDGYLFGMNGALSFYATGGTTYTITKSYSGSYFTMSYTQGNTRYIYQPNTYDVQIVRNASNRNWYYYPVSYDIP